MSEPFLAEIRIVGFNFAPQGWATCDGQLLDVSQYSALFSLLGTIYGGDGRTTFGLPDLRGRVPVHMGQGAGLTARPIGQRSGSETLVHSITTALMDEHHTHELAGGTAGSGVDSTSVATVPLPSNNSSSTPNHTNMQPYTTVNYIIAIQGTFPSF
jgi:microcystin-dependent protein